MRKVTMKFRFTICKKFIVYSSMFVLGGTLNSVAPLAADPQQQSIEQTVTKLPTKSLKLAKFEPEVGSVYQGASLPETWSRAGLKSQVEDYRRISGKAPAVITWFATLYNRGVLSSPRREIAFQLKNVKAMGAASLLKFSTHDFAPTGRSATSKQISQGVWDAYFEEFVDTVKEFGSPVFISINHEMNGNWYPYSQATRDSTNTAAEYVASWRHIVNLFRKRGANNVAWVWSPNAIDVGSIPAWKYYPGDEYVDWVGVSFYSSNSMPALDSLYREHSQRKPFFVTEWATSPTKSRLNPNYPGDEAWVNQFFSALETRYKRVKAISWFNWTTTGDGDYSLKRNAAQQLAYTRNINKPRYLEKASPLLLPLAPPNIKKEE